MKHLHFECVGGASGDMVLGALIELGVSADQLQRALAALPLGPFRIETRRASSMSITGLQALVHVEGHPEASEPASPFAVTPNPNRNPDPHPHHHHHDHHHHDDSHHEHEHAHPHEHRALSEIEAMIAHAGFPDAVAARATAIFRALGAAEAKIHGVPVEHIHFHEVGAADSIIDIVGACWALNALGIDSVSVGPIPLGHGVIQCAHGIFPNPSPASLELIGGLPVTQVDEPFELVTPTGAALLAGWRTADSIPAGASLRHVAYSVGRRALHHRPNVLRASLYENAGAGPERDTCQVLECNLDDTTPELAGILIEDLLSAGALDVTIAPVTMKKQRPGLLVSVLCHPDRRDAMIDILFRGSTTFGVREYTVQRTKLARRFETVQTSFGDVKIKVGSWKGDDITRAPELSDCQRVARERGVAVRAVYEAALRASHTGR